MTNALMLSIVSNSRLLREGIPLLLAPYLACTPAGLYDADPCGPPAAAALAAELPHAQGPAHHIALIDSSIGPACCAAWTRFWRTAPQPQPVILLELPDDVDTIVRSIELGICAYTPAGAPPAEVAATIRLAAEGRVTCSPEVTARLFARLAERQAERQARRRAEHPGARPVSTDLPNGGRRTAAPAAYELRLLLTDREYEVLQLVVAGLSNAEIAGALTIEVRTVKQHVHNIFGKLQLQNRVQAAARAAREGWFVRG